MHLMKKSKMVFMITIIYMMKQNLPYHKMVIRSRYKADLDNDNSSMKGQTPACTQPMTIVRLSA